MQTPNRETIERVFRRDFRKLLGFDVFDAYDEMQMLKHSEWFNQFVIEAFLTPT